MIVCIHHDRGWKFPGLGRVKKLRPYGHFFHCSTWQTIIATPQTLDAPCNPHVCLHEPT